MTELGQDTDGLLEAAAAADSTAWLERRRRIAMLEQA